VRGRERGKGGEKDKKKKVLGKAGKGSKGGKKILGWRHSKSGF